MFSKSIIESDGVKTHGYVVNSIEKGCSTGHNGFLKRHDEFLHEDKVFEIEPLTIDLIVNEQPWGG